MTRTPAAAALPLAPPTAERGRGIGSVGVATGAWLALTAGLRPLALPDEGRYVGIAREMLVSGDWLTPTLHGLPYFHKPPLFYWITAAAMALFGQNPAAARAAPVVGAWVAALALFLFLRRWSGDRIARRALVVFLTLPLVFGGAQYANMDMLVAGFISATVLLLAHAVLRLDRGLAPARGAARWAILAAYACAALGVLAKGLIGAVLPILVVVPWLLLTRRARFVRPLLSAGGLATFALIALPWFVLLQRRVPGFLDYFFVVQQFQRYAATGFNNVRPFWFYPAVLGLGALPWWPWLPWAARRAGRVNASDAAAAAARDVRLLMLVWAAAVTLFFSVPRSKIPGYIFPALPPLAWILAATLFARGEPGVRTRRLWGLSVAVCALLGLGVVIGLALHPLRSTRTLALALAHEAALDPAAASPAVYMLGEDYFDLPFYAHLAAPPHLVDDWHTPAVRERDNWRKELADAEDFLPAGGASPLVTPAQLPARLCRHAVSWLVGPTEAAARYAFLGRPLLTEGDVALWRIDLARNEMAGALGCRPAAKGIDRDDSATGSAARRRVVRIAPVRYERDVRGFGNDAEVRK